MNCIMLYIYNNVAIGCPVDYPPHAALMMMILSFSVTGVSSHWSRGIILLFLAIATPAAGKLISAARDMRVSAFVDVGWLLIITFMLLEIISMHS